ncbi:Aberrant root formation protein 4 [Camellia lanceoleosa]|uniref:Aberrant root formation protein 4 n=1 Tax=Camellia lanceoleosa TaxID=1840588 RepID=A0ACC0FP56_9ERIC|nr:Aberrant root formation protein 4 [Camellia lanceoleosa]
MPLRQIKNMEFLSKEEKDLLSKRGGIAVKLIDLADKNCEVYNVTLKQWKLKYTSNYCLVTGWNTFLTKNRLEAVEMVVIYAPDAVLRMNAFDALKKVLADIPTSLRFDTLMALIKNTDSSSMIAILIDCVRKEMHMDNCRRISIGNQVIRAQNNACDSAALWNAGALELVELILRPTHGRTCIPPRVGDAVLSALNLYRFILMKESTGNTNYTGVLSKKNLQKAYNEWLLPLRTLVTGIVAENKKDYDRLAMDTVCVLNPVELVLYHCIEVVEEKLKNAT